MPKNGIAVSYCSSIFSFLRCLHIVFHSAVPIYIPTNSVGGFLFSTSPPAFVFVDLLMMAILTDVRWYLIPALVNIYLIIRDVEHFFMYLLAICTSSLEKCLFRYFAHFSIVLLAFFAVKLYKWLLYSRD